MNHSTLGRERGEAKIRSLFEGTERPGDLRDQGFEKVRELRIGEESEEVSGGEGFRAKPQGGV